MNPFRPISISFSPNTEPDDIKLAWRILFQPWRWQKGGEIQKLEEKFKEYLQVKYAFSFNSGRSSLLAILKSLDISKQEEVLLQAFTCNAAVNPILWQKLNPVFVDIDESLNLDPKDLERKIAHSTSSGQASKIKAVIIQHTFGYPAKIEEIKNICQKYNLFLIEDCAHSLGAEYKSKKGGLPAEASAKAGTFGDAAFFSFGRDKIISSVFGGMVVTNNDKLAQKIKEFRKKIDYPSNSWIFQQLLHPISFAWCLPIYSCLNIGKGILYLKQKFKILSPSVYQEEKEGKKPFYFPQKMPNALAALALNQFKKFERFNRHRKEIAKIYNREFSWMKVRICANKDTEPIYMRYPIFVKNVYPVRNQGFLNGAKEIRQKLKKENIFVDDGWHTLPVVPPDTDLQKMNYIRGKCPRAEGVAQTILNLPTNINISKNDAQKIINILSRFIR